MGCKFSSRTVTQPESSSSSGSSTVNGGVSQYQAACRRDPDVQIFDANLHHRTSRLITSLATVSGGGSAEVASLSIDSLQQVTGCLIDTNKEVVDVILECKKDVWNNKELLEIVHDYFDYSIKTLDFFTALDNCLKRARDRQLIIQFTLHQFEEEMKNDQVFGSASEKFAKTLQELKCFREAGDPFTEEFFNVFGLVYKQQFQLFEKLQVRKHKLDKKLESVKVYRKVSNIIFIATFVAVVICSVVAAAVAVPPVASALAAAASAPVGGLGKWINSLWKKYEKELKAQKELYSTVELATYVTINDLDTVRGLVGKLEIEIEGLLSNADFALRDAEIVTVVIDEIKRKITGFMGAIDRLTEHSDEYSRYIRRARTLILHNIIKYPSSG